MKEEFIKLADFWIKELWQKGNADAVDLLHSENFVDHSSSGRDNTNEGFKSGIRELYLSFPDFFTEVEDFIVDEKKEIVTIRWKAKGMHKNYFMNFAPTNKVIFFKGIEILKVKENKITDRWGEWDGLNLIEQFIQSSIENVFKKINISG